MRCIGDIVTLHETSENRTLRDNNNQPQYLQHRLSNMGIADGPSTLSKPPETLSEDEIDDVLYIARANELPELAPCLTSLSQKYGTTPHAILLSSTDSETQNTPLHYAAANGHLGLVNSLLSHLSSSSASSDETEPLLVPFINKQNSSGNTALHWASLNGHLSIVKILLEQGADASILNGAGHDAVYEAEMAEKHEVVEWLLKEGKGLEKGLGDGGEEEGDAEMKSEELNAQGDESMDAGAESGKANGDERDIEGR